MAMPGSYNYIWPAQKLDINKMGSWEAASHWMCFPPPCLVGADTETHFTVPHTRLIYTHSFVPHTSIYYICPAIKGYAQKHPFQTMSHNCCRMDFFQKEINLRHPLSPFFSAWNHVSMTAISVYSYQCKTGRIFLFRNNID